MPAEATEDSAPVDGIPAQRLPGDLREQRAEGSGDELDDALARAEPGGRVSLLVARLAPQTADPAPAWIVELADRGERHGLTLAQLRVAASDLAWLAREAGQRYPDGAEWDAMPATGARTRRLVLAYAHGQRLRYDFKFDLLHTRARQWLAEFPEDALVMGLAAFAALGARSSQGIELYRQSVASDNADAKSMQACLHGMSFADHLPDHAQLMLDLSGTMMALGERGSVVHYRRAMALRKLGRYDQALEEIDLAIAMLDVGSNSVHQDFVRQRELIGVDRGMSLFAQQLTEQVGADVMARAEQKIEKATAELNERMATAQRVISDSLLKIVEILGLFVTLAGFLVGSGAVVLKASTFGERAIAMALVVVGSLVFFGLLRLVTGFRRR